MKKSLTPALVLAALAVFTGLGVARQADKQKSPTTSGETKPAPTPPVPLEATTINNSKSNTYRVAPKVMTGKVTQVNAREKTFAVEVSFFAGRMKGDFSRDTFKVGDTIDITYTQTPGGPMEATTVKSSKSNSSDRVATSPKVMTGAVTQEDDTADRIFCGDHTDTPRCCRRGGGYWVDLGDGGGCNFYGYNYRVMQVNEKNKTLTVAVVFSAAKLSKFPTVGQIIDITYTETPGGGPLEASNLNLSKSNIN